MKLSKYIAIAVLSLSIAAGTCACDTDYTKGTPFDTGENTEATGTPGADGTDKGNQGKPTEDPKGSGEKDTPVPTAPDTGKKPDDTVTGTPAAPTDTPTEEPSLTPTDAPTDVTPTGTPVSRDKFDRTEYRNMTFLIWLPAFEYGVFTGQESKGTFDYAIFSDVSKEEVLAYVSALKDGGYNLKTSESASSDTWTFETYNEKGWKAIMTYKGTTLTLGSGFEEEKEDQSEEIRRLYTTTMLQYIPEFKDGTFTGSETSGSTGDYIMYSNVSKDAVLSYIEQVKSAGYIYAPEENYSDTSTWYIALNEESFECSVEFDGSRLKIGCTDCRED